jgi:hypothetical protein
LPSTDKHGGENFPGTGLTGNVIAVYYGIKAKPREFIDYVAIAHKKGGPGTPAGIRTMVSFKMYS